MSSIKFCTIILITLLGWIKQRRGPFAPDFIQVWTSRYEFQKNRTKQVRKADRDMRAGLLVVGGNLMGDSIKRYLKFVKPYNWLIVLTIIHWNYEICDSAFHAASDENCHR